MIYAIFPCPVSFYVSFCPPSFCPLEMVLWFMLLTHVRYHFTPLSFCPRIIPPPPPPHFALWKWFNDLCYLPMSRINLPPWFILPPYHFTPYHFAPWNLLMYTIYPCPISFCPRIILPPYHFAPWKFFHDLHYFPISRIILPPGFILPPIFLPRSFCPLEIV